jgi:hypothetical protein
MHWKVFNIHGMAALAATNDVITGRSLFGFSTDAIYLGRLFSVWGLNNCLESTGPL